MVQSSKTGKAPSRRSFLLLAGLGGVAALGVGKLVDLNWPRCRLSPSLQSVQRTSRALGCDISMLVYHEDKSLAQRAVDAAFAELDTVEQVMSIYRPDSQLSQLNRDARLSHPHPYLLQVLRQARDISGKSNGAFDVTVQVLWDLYAANQRKGGLPWEADVAAARTKVDYRLIEILDSSVRIPVGFAVTLNGIAQGFAADRAAGTLRRHRIRHALINTGEIAALGAKPQADEAWKVGIQHPRAPDALISLAALKDRCMSTSGDYATTFSPDFSSNHIFDPATGQSPTQLSSVTVVADSATDADALSTAVFVLGAQKGLALLRSVPNTDALLVFKDGRVLKTEGLVFFS